MPTCLCVAWTLYLTRGILFTQLRGRLKSKRPAPPAPSSPGTGVRPGLARQCPRSGLTGRMWGQRGRRQEAPGGGQCHTPFLRNSRAQGSGSRAGVSGGERESHLVFQGGWWVLQRPALWSGSGSRPATELSGSLLMLRLTQDAAGIMFRSSKPRRLTVGQRGQEGQRAWMLQSQPAGAWESLSLSMVMMAMESPPTPWSLGP